MSSAAEFHGVYEDNVDAVARYATVLVGREHRDDVVAETFLRAWTAFDTYSSNGAPIVVWLLRIARNVSFDHARYHGRRDRVDGLLDRLTSETVEDEVGNLLLRERLRFVLDELSPAHRTVLELRFVEQLSVAEVSEAFDLSAEGVRSLTMRARKAAGSVALAHGLGENHPSSHRSDAS